MSKEKLELIVNTEICDTREVCENVLANYKDIIINTDILLQNKKSKEILSGYDTIINAGTIILTDSEIIIKEDFRVNKNTKIEEGKVYVICGKLEIEENSQNVLEKITKLYALGSLKYPMSLEDEFTKFVIDAKVTAYPDGCSFLDNTTVLDDMFEFMAEENLLYFAKEKIVITGIDIEPILAKNIRFHSKTLIVDKNIAKSVIPLFNKDVQLIILRENQHYFEGNTMLDDIFVQRFSGSIYIDGNVNINGDSDLQNIKNLVVSGRFDVLESRVNEINSIDIKYKKLTIVKGKMIENCGLISVDNTLLENVSEGITIRNCGMVKIDTELDCESIMNKLQISNCGLVQCTVDQKGAVQIASSNVGHITTHEEADNKRSEKSGEQQIVNADYHVL